MSETKQTILQIQIDQASALKDLQDTEKNLIALKAAQKGVNDEIKAGKGNTDELLKSKVQLDAQIKKETDTRKTLIQTVNAESGSMNAQKVVLADLIKQRNNLNTSTAEGKVHFGELNDKILTLTNSLKASEGAGGNFGRNVGNYNDILGKVNPKLAEMSSGLTGLLSPAAGVASAIGGLATLYAKSAVGAEDLATAQEALGSAFTISANRVGNATEGVGFFTKVATGAAFAIAQLTHLTGDEANKQIANTAIAISYQEKLRDLIVKQVEVQNEANKASREAKDLALIRDDAEKSFQERQEAAAKIVESVKQRQTLVTDVMHEQIEALIEQGKYEGNIVNGVIKNRELKIQILQKTEAISAAESENAKALERSQIALVRLEQEKKKQFKKEKEEETKEEKKNAAEIAKSRKELFNTFHEGFVGQQKDAQDTANKNIAEAKQEAAGIIKISQEKVKTLQEIDDADAQRKRDTNDLELKGKEAVEKKASQLLREGANKNKGIAIAEALINTYRAFAADLKLGFPYGEIAGALDLAIGFENVSKIKGITFARGGYTPKASSNLQPVGVVHANEYVVPARMVSSPQWSPVISQMESSRMRGYHDGGLATNTMTHPINQQAAINNTLKNVKQPVVSWKEGQVMNDRVAFKEGLTRK